MTTPNTTTTTTSSSGGSGNSNTSGASTTNPSATDTVMAAAAAEAKLAEDKLSRTQKIIQGFTINWMNMRNADTGAIVWESGDWSKTFKEELKVEVPASILRLRAVSREMNFSSKEIIQDFKLIQGVYLHGNKIEEWKFDFGFVMPGSTNSWQCTIEAAGGDQMIPPEVLSGHVVIDTQLYDGNTLVCKTSLRVYYV